MGMIGDDILDALPEMRAQAESRMSAEVSLAHPSGHAINQLTGIKTVEWETYYTGKANIQRSSNAAGRMLVAGQQVGVEATTGKVPHDVAVTKGDRLIVIACPDSPTLVDRELYVAAHDAGSQMIQQRFALTDNQG